MSEKEKTNKLTILSLSIIASSLLFSIALVHSTNQIAEGISSIELVSSTNKEVSDIQPQPAEQPQTQEIQSLSQEDFKEMVRSAAAVKGNEDAPVTVIEFSDYQCPFCRRHFNEVQGQLESEYIDKGKVRFVYLDFPLTSIHPGAVPAANAARCAGEQGLYWEAHDAIFEGQNPQGQGTVAYSVEDLKTWLANLPGVDNEALNSCIDSNKYVSQIQENLDLGVAAGIRGTPGFFINGELVSGAQPFSVFQQAIESQLS